MTIAMQGHHRALSSILSLPSLYFRFFGPGSGSSSSRARQDFMQPSIRPIRRDEDGGSAARPLMIDVEDSDFIANSVPVQGGSSVSGASDENLRSRIGNSS